MVAMLPLAALLGVLGACTVQGFRWALDALMGLYSSQHHLVAAAAALAPWQRVLVPCVAATAAGLVVWAGQRLLRGAPGPAYMEAVRVGDGRLPVAPNAVRAGASLLAVSGGITIGREGSMIQLAAVMASLVGRLSRMDEAHRRLIVACGAAAGFASAYHAPIAGTLFVAEIILGGLHLRVMAALLVAAMMGELTTQTLFAAGPLYLTRAVPPINFADLVDACLLGVLAGLVGPAFLWLLERTRQGFERRVPWVPLRFGLAGLVIGGLSVIRPEVWGNGFSTVQAFLTDPWTLSALVLVTALRLMAVTVASAAGVPGGVLTPTLALGGALGLMVAQGVQVPGGHADQALWALAGMSSLLAAITHAPAMSALMVFESTRSYNVVLAAMPACVLASVLSSMLRPRSVYSKALGAPVAPAGWAALPPPETRADREEDGKSGHEAAAATATAAPQGDEDLPPVVAESAAPEDAGVSPSAGAGAGAAVRTAGRGPQGGQ